MRRFIDMLWGVVQIGIHLALGPVMHRWRTRWGASVGEIERAHHFAPTRKGASDLRAH